LEKQARFWLTWKVLSKTVCVRVRKRADSQAVNDTRKAAELNDAHA